MIRNRPRVFAGLQLAIEMNAEMCDESPLALLDPPTRRTFIGPRIGPSIVLPLARSSHVAVMTAIGVEEKPGAVAPTSTISSRSARRRVGVPSQQRASDWASRAKRGGPAGCRMRVLTPKRTLPGSRANRDALHGVRHMWLPLLTPPFGRQGHFVSSWIRTATEPPFEPRDSAAPECSW